MAKRGQQIDELYISLGLDIARLQLDFDTAGKTVSQAVARLGSKTNQIKLKMDVDLAKLEGVGTELDKLKVKHQAINQELELQRKKEEILAAVLKDAQKIGGTGSDAAHRAETNLLKQQRAVAQTEAEVRKLNAEMQKLGGSVTQTTANSRTFAAVTAAGLAKAKGGVSSLAGGFSLLSAKAAAAMAILATGAGLFSLTKDAMQAGENFYRLTKRLHASAAEAGKMNRAFQLAGIDIMAVVPLIARLDKQVSLAGESGNETTKAMARFGISLLDAAGNLLPLNEQLSALAKGYAYATEMGQEEAYTAEVLGARGAALIPLLEQYDDLMQVAASVKTTGLLNPEEAHKTWLQWKAMEMEIGQLKSAFGTALLPLASELMPSVTASFREMVQVIQDNKDTIKDAVKGWGSALKTVAELLVFVGEQLHVVSERAQANKWLLDHHPAASSLIAVPILGGAVLDRMYGEEYKAYLKEQEVLKEKAKAEKEASAEAEKSKRAQFENAAAAKKRAEAEQKAAKATEEATKANQQLTESLYDLTHNELEKSLHSINQEVEALKEKGADVKLLDEYKMARQAKVYKDFQKNVSDTIQAVWKTELQNRLADIEREKQAWIQKGLDEVKATKWAEKEKVDAKRNAALQVLQSQKEEYQAYLQGGERGLAEYYKAAHGFTMDDLRMTPEQLMGFQQARKSMLENLLPNFRDPEVIAQEEQRMRDSFRLRMGGRDYSYDEVMGSMNAELKGIRQEMDKLGAAPVATDGGVGGSPQVTDNRQITVQVNIENAVTQDNEGMRFLADQVADRIKPAVENALGGGDNSYSNW